MPDGRLQQYLKGAVILLLLLIAHPTSATMALLEQSLDVVFHPDSTVEAGRFACGKALSGGAEVFLPLLTMSRSSCPDALFHEQIALALPGKSE